MKRQSKGFTLIECLISLLLLTITLVGGMAFYFYSQDLLQYSTHKRIAVETASSTLELLKNDYNVTLPQSVTLGGITGTRTITKQDVSGKTYKWVQVEVSWQEPSKTALQSVTLDSYISP